MNLIANESDSREEHTSAPLLSVIIPVYNAEAHLKNCIDSIIFQKYSSIEIIIVDDGSSDNSFHISRTYTEKYKNIKVIQSSHVGVSSARNKGMKASNGDYICFCDADDGYLPGSLIDAMGIILEHNLDVIIGSIVKVIDEKEIPCIPQFTNEKHLEIYTGERLQELRRWVLERSPDKLKELPCYSASGTDLENGFRLGAPVAKVIKRELALKIPFDDRVSLCEDLIYINQLLKNVGKVGITDSIWYKYIIRMNSSSHCKYYAQGIRDFTYLATSLFDFWDDFDEAYNKALSIRIVNCFWSIIETTIVTDPKYRWTDNTKIEVIKKLLEYPVFSVCAQYISEKDILYKKGKIKLFLVKHRFVHMILLLAIIKKYK